MNDLDIQISNKKNPNETIFNDKSSKNNDLGNFFIKLFSSLFNSLLASLGMVRLLIGLISVAILHFFGFLFDLSLGEQSPYLLLRQTIDSQLTYLFDLGNDLELLAFILRIIEGIYLSIKVPLQGANFIFFVSFCFLCASIIALGGGAIARLENNRIIGKDFNFLKDFAYIKSRATALVVSLIWPIFLMTTFAFVIILGGSLLNIPIVNIFVSLFSWIFLILGICIAVGFIGFVFSMPLILAIVTKKQLEGIESSHFGYALLFLRPLKFLILWISGLIIFALFYIVLFLILDFGISISKEIINGAIVFDTDKYWHHGVVVWLYGSYEYLFSSLFNAWIFSAVFSLGSVVFSFFED